MMRIVTPAKDWQFEKSFRIFDWYSRWDEVERVLSLPDVVEGLDTVMRAVCARRGVTWDRDKGPAYYSLFTMPEAEFPQDHPVAFYQCVGYCFAINTWAGVLGEAMFPQLDWRSLSATTQNSFCAVGFEGRKPQVLLNLLNTITESQHPEDVQHLLALAAIQGMFRDTPTIVERTIPEMLNEVRKSTKQVEPAPGSWLCPPGLASLQSSLKGQQ